jgi:hypothetical protein
MTVLRVLFALDLSPAVILACFRTYNRAPGERIVIMVLVVDRDQTQVIFGHTRALLLETPMLKNRLERETAESLELKGDVSIEVHVSNLSIRGRTCGAIRGDRCRAPVPGSRGTRRAASTSPQRFLAAFLMPNGTTRDSSFCE